MTFAQVVTAVAGRLDAAGVRYALMGGLAVALRGVQRATMELGFLLMLEDLETARGILTGPGCRRHPAHINGPPAGSRTAAR